MLKNVATNAFRTADSLYPGIDLQVATNRNTPAIPAHCQSLNNHSEAV